MSVLLLNPLATLGLLLFGVTIVVFGVAEFASQRHLRTAADLGVLDAAKYRRWQLNLFLLRWAAVFNLLDEAPGSSIRDPRLVRLEGLIRRLSRIG